jgi:hypothetical protein
MPQNGYIYLIPSDKCPIMTNGVAMSGQETHQAQPSTLAAVALAAKVVVIDERGEER